MWRAAAKGLPLPPDCLRGALFPWVSHLLQVATWNDHGPTLDALLDASVTAINERDMGGRTPLHHACADGHVPVVALLLHAKARVDICDSKGGSPLASQGHAAVVALLHQHKQGGRA